MKQTAAPRSEVGPFRVNSDYAERHPDADVSATELAINVVYTAELLGRHLEQVLRPYRLTRGSHNVLQILGGATEPLTPGDRRPHPTDRRSVLVEITDEGRRLLDELVPELIVREKEWSAPLPPARREQLIRTLGVLQDHLRHLGDESASSTPARSAG